MDVALLLGLLLGAAFCAAGGYVARGLRAPKPVPCEHQWDLRIGVVQRARNLDSADLVFIDRGPDRVRLLTGQTTVLLTCACGAISEHTIPGDAPSAAPLHTAAPKVVSIVKPGGSPRGSA